MKTEKVKARKITKGLGLLGTRYKNNPKYRDAPRTNKIKEWS